MTPEDGRKRILLIDDEPAVLEIARKMLEHLGYAVESRSSGEGAVAALGMDPEGFDLVITDLVMPDMEGTELVKRCLTIRPNLPVILCSGGEAPEVPPLQHEASRIQGFLMKPFTLARLAETVGGALKDPPAP